MDWDEVEVNNNALKRSWSTKTQPSWPNQLGQQKYITWPKGNFLETISSQQRYALLARSVANQNNQPNTDTEQATESVRIKRVEFRENVRAFFPPGTKQTVRNNEMSVLSGSP